jgi:hypothetical protein
MAPLALPWTHLVSQFGRIHGRIAIRFPKRGIATRVLPSVRYLISGAGRRVVRIDDEGVQGRRESETTYGENQR